MLSVKRWLHLPVGDQLNTEDGQVGHEHVDATEDVAPAGLVDIRRSRF